MSSTRLFAPGKTLTGKKGELWWPKQRECRIMSLTTMLMFFTSMQGQKPEVQSTCWTERFSSPPGLNLLLVQGMLDQVTPQHC